MRDKRKHNLGEVALDQPYYSASGLARAVKKLTAAWVCELCQKGVIKSTKTSGSYIITREDAQAWIDSRGNGDA
jgi:hypothetical protein